MYGATKLLFLLRIYLVITPWKFISISNSYMDLLFNSGFVTMKVSTAVKQGLALNWCMQV